MTWAQFVTHFYQWWSTITFCVTAAFVLGYGTLSPWYKSAFGRSLLLLDLGLAVTLLPSFLNFIFQINLMDNRVEQVSLIVALIVMTLAISYRLTLLFAVRRRSLWEQVRKQRLKDILAGMPEDERPRTPYKQEE